ncbi:MAG: response regulator [Xenococcaceae cyanobacterium MO_188.B32]|nr:response regulator [Xenococcaceae cyanobacterium MO_188.B32]
MKILLIEDDCLLADLVKRALKEQQNSIVDFASNGYDGLELANSFEYDLILLDLVLPKLNGIEVCQKIRSRGDHTPILLLTAQDTTSKKVSGLDAGADDYLVKPFEIEELLARIRALLRRGNDSLRPILQWGNLVLDPNNCQVEYNYRRVKLTAKEYALIELFLRHPHRIFSQSALLDHLWSLEDFPSENAVRTQIKGLRQKLKKAGAEANLIETIYGLGYRLKQRSESEITTTKRSNKPEILTDLPDNQGGNTSINYARQQSWDSSSLTKVWQQYRTQYLQQLQTLEQSIKALKTENWQDIVRKQAMKISHTLAGSLGSFGLAVASDKARQIEHILENTNNSLNQKDINNLLQILPELTAELTITEYCDTVVSHLTPLPLGSDIPHRLLIIDDDIALTKALIAEAKTWGIKAEVAHNLDEAKKAVSLIKPDVILLDLSFPESEEGGFELLQELSPQKSSIPVIVLTARESFTARVRVARMGGKGFLPKPVSPHQVMESINQILRQSYPPVAKILVVDDEHRTLDLIRTLLEPSGFQVTLLEDSREFWDILEQSNPDLIIAKVEMPYVNGIELCQVVRNDPRWYQLPILFTSVYQDAQTIQQVFTVGADDYLCQPIIPEELLARILNRLDKERYRRQLTETDALTGVSNRRSSIRQLNRMLKLAQRQQKHWCFIIIDLDNFKHINDSYGHDMGDVVLSSFGKLLKRVFRSEDVIARWGGEEFIFGLYDMTKSSAITRLTDLLTIFRQQRFIDARQNKFKVSFSAGVAEYPLDGDNIETLYQAADRALDRAKAKGKNV